MVLLFIVIQTCWLSLISTVLSEDNVKQIDINSVVNEEWKKLSM